VNLSMRMLQDSERGSVGNRPIKDGSFRSVDFKDGRLTQTPLQR
jgi:hypothetical protein